VDVAMASDGDECEVVSAVIEIHVRATLAARRDEHDPPSHPGRG
jgi:hypothetical protein